MIEIRETTFKNYEVVEVANQEIRLLATISTGPRILSLSAYGGDNLFVELPDTVLPYPGEGDLALHGGHRLWYAPEKPETTYIPDNNPVGWEDIENGIILTQPVDLPTQVQKKIKVEIARSGARVKVTHELEYLGDRSFTLAPWAITQIRPGGSAFIPQKTDNADANGLLPNRNIVLWPYTDVNSSNIQITNEGIYVYANMAGGALKIGSPNPDGWIVYELDGQLFVKRSQYMEGGSYLDRGASSQIYCNEYFIELETLAQVVELGPGERTAHVEEWEIFPADGWPEEIEPIFLGN
jgi:hypothetical protein